MFLLVLTNGFWLYSAVDLMATEKYRQLEEHSAVNRIAALESLCNKLVGGMSNDDAKRLLNELSPEFEAYEKEGRLSTIWLSFRLDDQSNVAKTDSCLPK